MTRESSDIDYKDYPMTTTNPTLNGTVTRSRGNHHFLIEGDSYDIMMTMIQKLK
jgi:hypothetical protein